MEQETRSAWSGTNKVEIKVCARFHFVTLRQHLRDKTVKGLVERRIGPIPPVPPSAAPHYDDHGEPAKATTRSAMCVAMRLALELPSNNVEANFSYLLVKIAFDPSIGLLPRAVPQIVCLSVSLPIADGRIWRGQQGNLLPIGCFYLYF
eukprot:scaffold307_cov162-Amphora_coffeaeformis.AAC.15